MARPDPDDDELLARVRQVLGSGPGDEGPSGSGWVPTSPGTGLDPDAPATLGIHAPATLGVDAPPTLDADAPPTLRPGRHRRPGPGWVRWPVGWRESRYRVRPAAVGGVLGLVAAIGVLWMVRVGLAQRAAEPVAVAASRTAVVARSVPSAFAGSGGSGPGGTPGGSAEPTVRSVLVHVVGQVARPGVVSIPDGGRVLDAIAAAGGALSSADLSRVNLARLVVDGEQIQVPAPGEALSAPPGPGPAGGTGGQIVDLNTADLAALDALPGVGPVLAQRILDWRREHGRFSAVQELGEVSGIGERLLAQLTPRVRV